MDNEFSTCGTGWFEYFSFSLVIAAVEFAPTWKNAYHVDPVGLQARVTINLRH
jgi:hypothetical protein